MDFVRRHKNKGLWMAGIVSGAYLLGHYAKRRLFELQEQAFKDRLAIDNLQRRFDQNQQDCAFTVLSLLPELADGIFDELSAERIAVALQSRQQQATAAVAEEGDDTPVPPPAADPYASLSKAELWHELKIVNFTRLITAIYALAMVNTLTRVQLNLVGRLMYLDSVVHDDPAEPLASATAARFLSARAEGMFLTMSWHLLHSGWRTCAMRVRAAVESVLGGVPLKKTLSQRDFEALMMQVRARVEASDFSDPAMGPFDMMLPTESDELATLQAGEFPLLVSDVENGRMVQPEFRRLMDETRDVLESPHARTALVAAVASAFGIAMDAVATQAWPAISVLPDPLPSVVMAAVEDVGAAEEEGMMTTVATAVAAPDAAVMRGEVPLAALFPHVKQLVHVVMHGVPNQYVAVRSFPFFYTFGLWSLISCGVNYRLWPASKSSTSSPWPFMPSTATRVSNKIL
ncbi:Peroxin-3 [Blastocladiella britannica]|nr:Peroxin-3 [Blastocladiella britannica]